VDSNRVVVVKLSEAFGDFWQDLASDIGFELVLLEDAERPIPRDVAAVIVGAGGVEPEALKWLAPREMRKGASVFVVGADPRRRIALQVTGAGARDYFALPDDIELLRNAISECVLRQLHETHNPSATPSFVDSEAFAEIEGESPALKEVLWMAARLLPHRDATALILGSTGTGKELLARALHFGGPRRKSPFVPINCSALPDNLVESELFGHERGAFTDAHTAKPGLFEIADGGTLFLDEVGDLPLELQAKLLRALDDRVIRRVGGTTSRELDVRIVAATNEDLEQAVEDGRFREDLYFRLSVVILSLPPLRERDEDVLFVASALLKKLAKQHGLPVPTISTDDKARLMAYHWPGNVRELKNTVERTLLLSPPGEFFLDLRQAKTKLRREDETGAVLPFPAPMAEITKVAARETLRRCEGNRSEAARRLGISRRKLRGHLGEPDIEGARLA